MAVVGFDVGNSSAYIAVARGGGIETIANEDSDRRTPTIVSFGDHNRMLGSAGKTQVISNYKNTVTAFKRLVGRKYDDPLVQAELPRMLNEVVRTPDGGVGVKVQYMGEKETFTPEQLYAMFLTKLKMTAEASLQTKVVDFVLSVPQYYTNVERKSILDVASIAGMNCLRIINDTTAAALAYGIYKQDLPAPEEKPRVVVFVDMGSASLQVSVCAFNKGKLKVLNVGSETCLGGRDFDQVIADHFVEEFKTKYRIDIRENARALLRLTQECEKLKKLMSANATEIPMNIESIMNDRDVSGRMKRADFENLAANLLKRIENTLKSVQTQIKLKPDEIYAVEIIGGSTRVPSVKEIIKKVFKKDASTTLNQDEAVARGCALQCAILSPTFRVREFNVADLTPYSISLLWKATEGEDGEMEVFPANHQAPFSKMLTFYRKGPFELTAKYTDNSKVPHTDTCLGRFEIKNVKPTAEGESSKVKVKVRVSGHGIFKVSSASLMEKIPPTAADQNDKEGDEKMSVDGKSVNEGDVPMETEPQTNENASPTAEEDSKSQSSNGETPMNAENGPQPTEKKPEANDSPDASAAESGDKTEPKKAKKTVRYFDLPVEEITKGLTTKDLTNLVEQEGKMNAQDKLERERNDARNSVEEYVYYMKDKLCEELREYVSPADREAFLKSLDNTENWLYEDGEEETKSVYAERLATLKKVGDPIAERRKEAVERPKVLEELGRCLVHYRKALTIYQDGDDKYSHIEKTEMEKVQKWVEEKEAWRNAKTNAQNQLAVHQNPVVLARDIRSETASLKSNCDAILNKAKPKPKEEPPKEAETKTGEANASDPKDDKMEDGTTPAGDTPSSEPGTAKPDVEMELD
ncbi:97 kDa heat shock protein-like [Asterias rubens]|uniref:97 kDa heat shock protein-like n=1 Tax=Asterias rubens TaxID=7604 RepID=UPI00145580FE|nr:97 kDa heat shock protein-like [Asterias rubens]